MMVISSIFAYGEPAGAEGTSRGRPIDEFLSDFTSSPIDATPPTAGSPRSYPDRLCKVAAAAARKVTFPIGTDLERGGEPRNNSRAALARWYFTFHVPLLHHYLHIKLDGETAIGKGGYDRGLRKVGRSTHPKRNRPPAHNTKKNQQRSTIFFVLPLIEYMLID